MPPQSLAEIGGKQPQLDADYWLSHMLLTRLEIRIHSDGPNQPPHAGPGPRVVRQPRREHWLELCRDSHGISWCVLHGPSWFDIKLISVSTGISCSMASMLVAMPLTSYDSVPVLKGGRPTIYQTSTCRFVSA